MQVIYQKKIYYVLATSYIGDHKLYKLASRFSLGAPFAALKNKCIKV